MAFEYAIALTGGIATGKSTVAKIFSSLGFEIIDADRVAHEILDREKDKIAELFGKEYIVNNRVDRKALGSLIFSNKKEKLRLETLLHPLIFSEIKVKSIKLDKRKRPYLVDIPLFFESNRYPINKIIVVYIPRKLQLKRLMQRDGSEQLVAQQRINSQLSIEKKKHRATYLIDNQGDMNALQQLCAKVKDKIIFDYKGN